MAVSAGIARAQTGEPPRPATLPARSGDLPTEAGGATTQVRFAILEKKFARRILEVEAASEYSESSEKPLKVLAFDEARFGLINWHRRRYCPEGFRPPYTVHRRYEWTYLYAAVDPATGESVCAYLPRVDSECLEAYLEHLGEIYADYRVVLVLDNAPSHTAKELKVPENIELLALPTYSPELNPVERWFQEFRRALSNKVFESISSLQQALTKALEPYWRDPGLLRSLTGFPWWRWAIEALRHQSP